MDKILIKWHFIDTRFEFFFIIFQKRGVKICLRIKAGGNSLKMSDLGQIEELTICASLRSTAA